MLIALSLVGAAFGGIVALVNEKFGKEEGFRASSILSGILAVLCVLLL